MKIQHINGYEFEIPNRDSLYELLDIESFHYTKYFREISLRQLSKLLKEYLILHGQISFNEYRVVCNDYNKKYTNIKQTPFEQAFINLVKGWREG